jgi:hypothetical protein
MAENLKSKNVNGVLGELGHWKRRAHPGLPEGVRRI